eukprot:CAMPEP_0202813934 /NCGR_PEP_ID=MMETSP1389-20130828/5164_1 /ASSEMBLY_ACC=CAM_ASM_000865 /TAXON_ID=302021 /ORGANISM="Rhodomonas sp., Strain CCMP768" /LENGTH=77 /DNA_ID=CAMNT_0049485603 /DNA_START=159 /DNA_END=392 /DNA_ORIENTATION=+
MKSALVCPSASGCDPWIGLPSSAREHKATLPAQLGAATRSFPSNAAAISLSVTSHSSSATEISSAFADGVATLQSAR